ncbi:MAG: FKBP-type peptidyl-prolyl cis-trans isomerase [Thermoplasmata archaeon]|nr:FKBP-type peptidyl-prolyl cis-trans isomerase [Thermoplasmata archaeon]
MAAGPSWIPYAALAVVVILVGAGIGLYVYYHAKASTPQPVRTVHVGDNVTVDYVGVFGSGAQDGRVFDTSLFSVASSGSAWPKSLEYTARGTTASSYKPLGVHVGPNTPTASGYTIGNVSFITVVPGFWEGLLGLPGNQTTSIVVPPPLGYGYGDPGCRVTHSLLQTVPVLVTVTRANFTTVFSGQTPQTGSTLTDPHYGWPIFILSANGTFVTYENLATVGDTASPAGWPVHVTSVTSTANGSGTITLQNELTVADAGVLLGKPVGETAPCTTGTSNQFLVSAVNLLNGTYTEDFNREVNGQTLIFLVTVLNIYP